jgi:hypothetical protein
LRQVRNPIHELRIDLSHAMEMQTGTHAFSYIVHINYDEIVLAHDDGRPGKLKVYAENSPLKAISSYAAFIETIYNVIEGRILKLNQKFRDVLIDDQFKILALFHS